MSFFRIWGRSKAAFEPMLQKNAQSWSKSHSAAFYRVAPPRTPQAWRLQEVLREFWRHRNRDMLTKCTKRSFRLPYFFSLVNKYFIQKNFRFPENKTKPHIDYLSSKGDAEGS